MLLFLFWLADFILLQYSKDADSDTRVLRRIARDTVERGRTLESIMTQYQNFVKPMHEEWVEPSKTGADIIVNSETGTPLEIFALACLSDKNMLLV